MEQKQQHPINHRLMQQIDPQRVSAQPAQRRTDRPAQRLHAGPPHAEMQEVPRPEQKQPGQQRKVIRGEKAPREKAEERREEVGIPDTRQQYLPRAQLPETILRVVGCREEQQRHHQPGPGRDLLQQRLQKAGDEHGRPQQGEHPEHDPVLRHEQQRDRRDQHPCPGNDQPAPQRAMPQRQAEARQQMLCCHRCPCQPVYHAADMPNKKIRSQQA